MKARENNGTAQWSSSTRHLAMALGGAVAITAGVTLLGDAGNFFRALYPVEQQYFGSAEAIWARSVTVFLSLLYIFGTLAYVRMSAVLKYNQHWDLTLDFKHAGSSLRYWVWGLLAAILLLRAPLGVSSGPMAADFTETVWASSAGTLVGMGLLFFMAWAVTSTSGAPLQGFFGKVQDTPLTYIALMGTLPALSMVWNGFSALNLGLVLGLAFFSYTLVTKANAAICNNEEVLAARALDGFSEVRDGQR